VSEAQRGERRVARVALWGAAACCAAAIGACTVPRTERGSAPSVAPVRSADDAPESSSALELGDVDARPLHREWLAIDLATAVRVAAASSFDVQQARLRVESASGEYESRSGALFPGLSPALLLDDVSGRVRAIDGPLLAADFTSFAPTVLLRWALNPGQAIYERVAARRRLEASEHDERGARQEAIRTAAVQYYELVLARGRLAVAERALRESEEFVRIAATRQRAGVGLEADQLLAESQLARRQQELVLALESLHGASISLALTLRLDPAVSLAPSEAQLAEKQLVDETLELDELLGIAVEWREDLAAVRALLEASDADRKARKWNLLGPRVDLGYQVGTLRSDTALGDFPASTQRRATAGASFNWSLATRGELRVAGAAQDAALLEAERRFEAARAQVLRARLASSTCSQLVPIARRQLQATEERLRLTQSGLRAGSSLALDVLQAEEAVDRARLALCEAVVRYNTAQVDLLAALGVIGEDAL
jgi:protease secretion system outer membrane protein